MSAINDSAIDIQGRQRQSGLEKPGIFDQIVGFFDRMGTIASRDVPIREKIKIENDPFPIKALAGIAIIGVILYKAVK